MSIRPPGASAGPSGSCAIRERPSPGAVSRSRAKRGAAIGSPPRTSAATSSVMAARSALRAARAQVLFASAPFKSVRARIAPDAIEAIAASPAPSVSPRTRKRARLSAWSLRWYWRSTRWRRTESRRSESPHDVFDGGHAGTGLSIAGEAPASAQKMNAAPSAKPVPRSGSVPWPGPVPWADPVPWPGPVAWPEYAPWAVPPPPGYLKKIGETMLNDWVAKAGADGKAVVDAVVEVYMCVEDACVPRLTRLLPPQILGHRVLARDALGRGLRLRVATANATSDTPASTRTSPCASGAATGGLDDRFPSRLARVEMALDVFQFNDRVIDQAPHTGRPLIFGFDAMVTYRLRAVTMVAAMVVRYMNSIGHRAKAGLRFSDFSHTVTTNRLSAAMSWLEAPNICHRYTQVPVRTSNRVQIIEKMVETCMLRNNGKVSPTHSARVTRITRNTSCVTVSTITTKTPKPKAVPKRSGRAPKVAA